MMLVDVGSARLFFDVVGESLDVATPKMEKRPTLILLHGGPGYDHSTLRPYFDRYSDTHQLIYLDHRGCGRSTGAQETWHLDQWADDLAVFCKTLGIDSPVVFGQSFGGMVAMHFAARHPARLSKLILSSTAAQFRLDETVKIMRELGGDRAAEVSYQFFSSPSQGAYDIYAEVCLPLYSNPNAKGASAFRERAIERPEVALHFFADEMATMDMRAEIANITCPTLVIGGTLDPVTPTLCSQVITDSIGENACLQMFEGCGHGPHRDDPDGAEKVMRHFLANST
jgi:pimeloyl-ACP methyl ester carboxylesterase